MTSPSVARIGPGVAGRWYPAGKGALADAVDRLLDEAPEARVADAVVAPHAGYAYSGATAAAAFRRFAGSTTRLWVLLGPSHHHAFRGARLPDASALATPLGDVPIDLQRVAALAARPAFALDNRAFAREHSLESELPFLQRAIGDGTELAIVPILLGGLSSADDLREIATALRPLAQARAGFVLSSDFTHYGEGFGYVPFRGDVEERLRELDLGAAERIVAGDAVGFRDYCRRTGATICGREAIEVALHLGFGRGRIDAYATSGAMTGDWEHTVSYAAIALDGDAA